MILLIDNYDSFSYNVVQLVGQIEPDIRVVRNDAVSVEDVRRMDPDGIVLSPGPGRPEDAGICVDVVRDLGADIPILGVCLGHQAIGVAYGANVSYAKRLMHGKQSETQVDTASPLFAGCSPRTAVARYHSLAVQDEGLPGSLIVTARADDGEIMAMQHRANPVYGVQFHPESIMTPEGMRMVRNFIDLTKDTKE
ncbi:anthranilate synthase component II [Bifidobacterium magnum]|uniref:Anthranilate synthase component II n=1 Tax=Bifidobacterium magnum TaxID=1692 RepID=A0A087BCL5_9BIFI|nr:aminodeoxychorismate/anthranilate synthase component II [Bifidobacterium magnum]KFI68765.1 Anthranilate synthase component II [Bifidobacterium magnum]